MAAKKPGCLANLIALVIVGVLVVWGIQSCGTCVEEADRQAGKRQAARQRERKRLEEISDPAGFEAALRKHLGTNNRNRSKLTSLSVEGGQVKFTLSLDDNLGKSLIKYGGFSDLCDVFQVLLDGRLDWTDAYVTCTFALRDKYGNESESRVMGGYFKRSELERVNWENFDVEDLPKIAGNFYLHPELREE